MATRKFDEFYTDKGIELFSWGTPNGQKISIFLEELGIPYTLHLVDISTNVQKTEWFLQNINPNGRIPAIVDHDNGKFPVFESGAILLYISEKYNSKFLPTDEKKRSQAIQWLFWQVGGIGPMQGQAGFFSKFAPEKIPFAIERYQKETRRLYEVLDKQLEGKEFVIGDLSVADFALYPWVKNYSWVGVSVEGLKNLTRWVDTLAKRDAVKKGIDVLVPPKKD